MNQKKTCIVSGDDDIVEDFNMMLQEKMDKDVLLLKGHQINGAICLTKHKNPHTMDRMTKEECDNAFKPLDSIGLGECEIKKRRNNTKALILKK